MFWHNLGTLLRNLCFGIGAVSGAIVISLMMMVAPWIAVVAVISVVIYCAAKEKKL